MVNRDLPMVRDKIDLDAGIAWIVSGYLMVVDFGDGKVALYDVFGGNHTIARSISVLRITGTPCSIIQWVTRWF